MYRLPKTLLGSIAGRQHNHHLGAARMGGRALGLDNGGLGSPVKGWFLLPRYVTNYYGAARLVANMLVATSLIESGDRDTNSANSITFKVCLAGFVLLACMNYLRAAFAKVSHNGKHKH